MRNAAWVLTRLAPGAGYTHWKQTVFYFPDYATIKQNETLEGTYSCKVNRENPVSPSAAMHTRDWHSLRFLLRV